MSRKGLRSKYGSYASSSSNVPKYAVYLGVDHNKTPDEHGNDASSSTTGYRFDISFAKDSYSKKIIAEWKPNLNMWEKYFPQR